jgi:hypothetical protein
MLVDQGTKDILLFVVPHVLQHLSEFVLCVLFIFVHYLSLLDVDGWLPSFCFIGWTLVAILFEMTRLLAIETGMFLPFFFDWFCRIYVHTIFRTDVIPLFVVEELKEIGF